MGLFSSSKRSTNNNDNRIINDYANAVWDNSHTVTNSNEQTIDGDFNNNTGSITMVDPNAIEGALEISGQAMGLADSVVGQNTALSSYAIGQNTDLAGYVVDEAGSMLDSSLEFADSTFQNANNNMTAFNTSALQLTDNLSQRGMNGALAVHDSAMMQIDAGSDLAMGLASNARAQSSETIGALGDGFEQMMQFTEQFSRSDGAALAKTNMETVAVLAGAGIVLAFMFRGK
jgi:hypothetical protein